MSWLAAGIGLTQAVPSPKWPGLNWSKPFSFSLLCLLGNRPHAKTSS